MAAYVARDSPRSAQRLVESILQRTTQLELFPQSGRIVPEFGREDIREVIVGRYRVVYQIRGATVGIITVHHGARRLADIELPESP